MRIGQKISQRLSDAVDGLYWVFSPREYTKRVAARGLSRFAEDRLRKLDANNAFTTAADNDRVRGERWLASDASPDAGLEEDIEELQRRSDDLYRNNTIAHSAIESRVSQEVGVGILPKPRIRKAAGISKAQARKWNEEISLALERWTSRGVDKSRLFSLSQVQKTAVRSYANYGEAFALLGDLISPRGGLPMVIDLINPRRVETPPDYAVDADVRMGVRYNSSGVVQGYYVRTQHPGDPVDEFRHEYYPRLDDLGQPRMLHVFDPLFPGQSRGFPWLVAAFARIKDLDDFFEAELVAKQVEACFALIFQKSSEGGLSPVDTATAAAGDVDSDRRRLQDIEPGMIHYAAEGETVSPIDPSRPGANFAPFVEASLRSIAAALNYPYELLAKNFFRTTFSSGQLAMLDGRMGFKMRQQAVIEQLLQPIYRRFVHELVLLGETTIPGLDYTSSPWLYERHHWQPQGHGYLNPRDEVAANVELLDNDMTTMSDIYAQQGADSDEKLAQRREEKLAEVEIEVEVRKRRFELEEAAGLPHEEQDPAEDEDDGEPSSQSKEDEKEEVGA